MKIRFWGVRGSLATPLSNTNLKDKITASLELAVEAGLSDKEAVADFFDTLPEHVRLTAGGNTTCLEISAGDTCLIMDAGTGIRPLGLDLMQRAGNNPITAHIMISHTHWDHIQGIPFFTPFFVPDYEWDIYAPRGIGQSLQETLAGQSLVLAECLQTRLTQENAITTNTETKTTSA